jgi:benzoyl-CoA reductase/2-hydroxyglutaryl-CoA dehydratase subunit BcrC/BadD/HgdB
MTDSQPRKITLDEWDGRYAQLRAAGLSELGYGGPLRRHVADGDVRLLKLRTDNSAASLRLWNFLLSEEDRLHRCLAEGKRLVGTMKDLGTVPVMAYALGNLAAFYPDGAWWLPCLLETDRGKGDRHLLPERPSGCFAQKVPVPFSTLGLLEIADSLGIDDSFCPVRALLGAFVAGNRFPIPGLLTCSVGATCDDFSAIAQRLESLGFPILWWEIPHRRRPEAQEEAVALPGGFRAPADQVAFVKAELDRVRLALEAYAQRPLGDEQLAEGIARANQVRRRLADLRQLCFTADPCPLPALEMLIAEMLAIHFCSDQNETLAVLTELVGEVRRRVEAGIGVLPADAVRIFWVNPVADLRVMNILEDVGGRVCGADNMFCHALDEIPTDLPPLEALARMALADPMVGSAVDRAQRICADTRRFGARGVVISRIPGASHCAMEAAIIGDVIRGQLDVPVVEMEVPPVTDSLEPALRTRLEALVEMICSRD